MINIDVIRKIQQLHFEQDKSLRQISKELSLSRTTVSKYLKFEVGVTPNPQYQRSVKMYPKLGLFVNALTQRLDQDYSLPKEQQLKVVVHFEWLKEQGYAGQYCSVATFCRLYRVKKASNKPSTKLV